jgi:hypothetical protein
VLSNQVTHQLLRRLTWLLDAGVEPAIFRQRPVAERAVRADRVIIMPLGGELRPRMAERGEQVHSGVNRAGDR